MTNSPTVPANEAAELSFGLASRHVRYFRAQVEDWYDVCRLLTDWEDRYLLDDPLPAERLAEHARLLEEFERVGQWLLSAAQSKDYPDRDTAELITLTIRDLKDRRAMWHGPKMSEQRRAEILKACCTSMASKKEVAKLMKGGGCSADAHGPRDFGLTRQVP